MNPRKETSMYPPQAVAVPSRFILLPAKVFTAACLVVGLLFAARSQAQQQLVTKNHISAAMAAGIPTGQTAVSPTANQSNEVPSSVYAIYPTTVKKSATVIIEAARDEWATLKILDMNGEMVLEQQMAVSQGTNKVPVFFVSGLEKGRYATMLSLEDKLYFAPFVKE